MILMGSHGSEWLGTMGIIIGIEFGTTLFNVSKLVVNSVNQYPWLRMDDLLVHNGELLGQQWSMSDPCPQDNCYQSMTQGGM